MTDIVERLRDKCDRKFINALCEDAADEIERLRALVEDALRGLHNDFEPDNQSALYKRIAAALKDTTP